MLHKHCYFIIKQSNSYFSVLLNIYCFGVKRNDSCFGVRRNISCFSTLPNEPFVWDDLLAFWVQWRSNLHPPSSLAWYTLLAGLVLWRRNPYFSSMSSLVLQLLLFSWCIVMVLYTYVRILPLCVELALACYVFIFSIFLYIECVHVVPLAPFCQATFSLAFPHVQLFSVVVPMG